MNTKILIADDDQMLRRLLSDIIKKQGYEAILAKDGQEALDVFFHEGDISLCILDVMMPIYTGYEVLESIREHSQVPVVMLTALDEELSELKGLQKGADDYISKPFSYAILLARVEKLLKKEMQQLEQTSEKGKLKIDFLGHMVQREGEEIALNNKEFSLLVHLVTNENQVLSREQLLAKSWGYDYEGEIRTVDTHVKMLRKKLGDCGEYVVTVRGAGYKFQVKT